MSQILEPHGLISVPSPRPSIPNLKRCDGVKPSGLIHPIRLLPARSWCHAPIDAQWRQAQIAIDLMAKGRMGWKGTVKAHPRSKFLVPPRCGSACTPSLTTLGEILVRMILRWHHHDCAQADNHSPLLEFFRIHRIRGLNLPFRLATGESARPVLGSPRSISACLQERPGRE